MKRSFALCAVFVFAALLLGAAGALASVESDFTDAWNDFHALADDSQRGQYRSNWQDLEKRFLAIYRADPGGDYAAKSLYYAGRVNTQMGLRSYLKSDFHKAVDYFHRVATRFPEHSWTDDALYRAATVSLHYLDDPEQAEQELRTIISYYPDGDMLASAETMLSELMGGDITAQMPPPPLDIPDEQDDGQLQAASDEEVVVPLPEGSYETAALPCPVEEPRVHEPAPSGVNRLNEVRFQSSDDYTRIVIDVDREVPYTYQVLAADPANDKPPRLYVDLQETRVASSAENLDVADGILTRVRIGQYQPRVARVVLDFEDMQQYQVFALNNPFRLIIDVSGPQSSPPPVPEQEEENFEPPPSLAEILSDLPVPGESPHQETAEAQEPEAVEPAPAEPEQATPVHPEVAVAPPAYELPPDHQSETLVEQLGLTVQTIMLDPGHGGRDPGASGNDLVEKDINLKFALMLGELLTQRGYTVIYTRDDDTFIPLEERSGEANVRKADLFISIHCNASPPLAEASLHGLETYSLDLASSQDAVRVAARENDGTTRSISDLDVILTDLMLNSKIKESKELADCVHGELLQSARQIYDIHDYGTRTAPFYVLMGTKMPAILVELGYITNPEDASHLADDEYLHRQAAGLVQGIEEYRRQIEQFASLN